MPKCKSCGAEIRFVKLPSGKLSPVEMDEQKFYVESMESFVLVPGHIPHWGNCPGANKHRRPKITNQNIGPLSKRDRGA